MADSLLHKITGFIEIEKPDLPVNAGGQLPGTISRPNPVPAPRPPAAPSGGPNAPPWGLSGYPWQPGSVTAPVPHYGSGGGGSGNGGYIDVGFILGNNPNPTLPQTDKPPPAPIIG